MEYRLPPPVRISGKTAPAAVLRELSTCPPNGDEAERTAAFPSETCAEDGRREPVSLSALSDFIHYFSHAFDMTNPT